MSATMCPGCGQKPLVGAETVCFDCLAKNWRGYGWMDPLSPTDPTPTQTPREVCGKRVTRADGTWLPCTLEKSHGIVNGMGCGVSWDDAPEPAWNPRDVERRKAERRALAATGDAPLSESDVADLRDTFDRLPAADREGVEWARREGHRLLTAYTTLAAQGAAARAERDELKERVKVAEGRLADYERDAQAQTVVRPTDTPPGVADYEQMLRATRPTDTGRDK